MKKILLVIGLILAIGITPANSANLWRNGDGEETLLGTETVSDIDTAIFQRMTAPLDRLLSSYNGTVVLKFDSTSQVTLSLGEITCSNTAGTIRRMRKNTADVTVTWADIDTGAEAANTTYYIYAVADANATTFTATISTNSTTPTGKTYYKRVGQFTNDGSSNITVLQNDNDRVVVSTGTIANGATISLPSGWAQDECDWTVGLGSGAVTGSHPDGIYYTISVDSSRVVTATSNDIGGGGGSTGVNHTANYIIACYR